jgi:hypothetical protein
MNNIQIKKTIRLLSIITIIQITFVFVGQIGSNALATQTTNKAMLSFNKNQVDSLTIKAADKSSITLIKEEGKWQTNTGFAIDKSLLNNLLNKLHKLKHGLAVATSNNALKRFKVSKDDFERKIILKKAGKALEILYLGSGAGVDQTLARREKENAIYSVALGIYDVPVTKKAWLDTNILTLEKKNITTIQLDNTVFHKENTTAENITIWKADKLPKDKQINQKAINDGMLSLASFYFEDILGKENKEEYGLDKPILTFSIDYKKEKRKYQFGKFKNKKNMC